MYGRVSLYMRVSLHEACSIMYGRVSLHVCFITRGVSHVGVLHYILAIQRKGVP